MTSFDVKARTIFLAKHGSHCYGLNVSTSDLDMKGICIEPLKFHYGFLNNFEQHIELVGNGNPNDLTIFSLKKFAKLASDNNPNIIEILFCDDSDVLQIDDYGEELRAARRSFLSTRAFYTFAGYAHSQLKRIKTHRGWLLNPPKEPPSRKDYGLRQDFSFSQTEMGAFATVIDDGLENSLSNEALSLYSKERAYSTMVTQWSQYQEWKKNRNPARAEIESRYGFDTKHGMHLLRLMRMAVEIIRDGNVIVKRHDREELLAVRNGQRSYDSLIEEAEKLEKLAKDHYDSSPLPKKPNLKEIDKLVVGLTERYLKENG